MDDNANPDPLDAYRRKRSFDRTPEPSAERDDRSDDRDQEAAVPASDVQPSSGRFVVQEHHARRLHWDLRLERNGVLVSWALPRGVPYSPDDNHLAVHTEDHPLEYLTFKGDIPAGEYGGGTMSVWDQGTYEAEKFTSTEVIARFDGERMRGKYALFSTRSRKGRDGVSADADRNWMIHRMDPPQVAADPMPTSLTPMLATAGTLPHSHDNGDADWAFEVKWDGIRAVAFADPGRLRLSSRTGRDITGQYREVAPLSRQLGSHRAVLDGELVAFDSGRPSFQLLQRRMNVTTDADIRRSMREIPVVYVIFDLLYLDGHSLLAQHYGQRRSLLTSLELGGASWQVPEYQKGDGAALLAATREQGLEGIIAKRLTSIYQPGRRSRQWVKIKNVRRQEVVIGGWVPGVGQRASSLGALAVGVHVDGRLQYAGKVGTGFTEATLTALRDRLTALETSDSPFHGRQPQRNTVFVQPELVCEVEFAEWTESDTMRQPSYLGLRDDKPAADVVRE
jgi:bifunctional non-homologous end joining protein LigD